MSLIEIKFLPFTGRASLSIETPLGTMRAALELAAKDGADLRGADLRGADLRGADLYCADLCGADLRGALEVPPLALAQNAIIPSDGDVTGWKKCKGGVLVKVLVPADAKRSHSTGRKCRAEFVRVLEVVGATEGISTHDGHTAYRVGETVRCDKWNEDRWAECAGGIHFFITRLEAEAY